MMWHNTEKIRKKKPTSATGHQTPINKIPKLFKLLHKLVRIRLSTKAFPRINKITKKSRPKQFH